MNPLVHTMEAQFHGAANASALRALHQRGDWNGLLEYALLLAELEASQNHRFGGWFVRQCVTPLACRTCASRSFGLYQCVRHI
jgi:hypothetical protein